LRDIAFEHAIDEAPLVRRNRRVEQPARGAAHERRLVDGVLERYVAQGIEYHAVRTRQAGPSYFVEMHVLVPGAWSVQRGHDLAEEIEGKVRDVLPRAHVLTHIEPREDPVSHQDVELRGGR